MKKLSIRIKLINQRFRQRKIIICGCFIIYGMCFMSCNNNDESSSLYIASLNKSDTFLRDIPYKLNGTTTIFYDFKNNYEKKLGLQTLNNGFDSVTIRLWCGLIPKNLQQLIIIENLKGKWSGKIINYIADYNKIDHFSIDSIIHEEIKNLNPRSNWNNLIKNIIEFKIFTLTEGNLIPNYPDFSDPGSITIEVATKNMYRFYTYEAPFDAKGSISEASNLINILGLLEKEFSLTLYPKY